MAKVFISYRHVDPDEQLADALQDQLRERGVDVFVDKQIEVGSRWVEEIERQLRASEFFVAFLSAESIRSDMVRQEISWAHDLEKGGRITILPVRVAFSGELPYDLGAYLNPIQYVKWERDAPFDQVSDTIVRAVLAGDPLPQAGGDADEEPDPERLRLLAEATDHRGAPLPVADPRLETGTLDPSSPFYIRRPEDAQLERLIQQRGETFVIKAPRQFGKSSLMARARSLAQGQGSRTAIIDFQLMDETHLESLDRLCRFLAHKMTRAFRTAIKPDDVWDEDLGPKESLTLFIEDAVLQAGETPVLLCLDEADRVFERPFRDDFFTAVRGWHNKRAEDDIWKRFNLVVVHSTNATLWIQEVRNSPFNVGHRLRLAGFDTDQTAELNRRHGEPLRSATDVAQVTLLLGGQPYLMRHAFYTLATVGGSLADLDREAASDRGPFGDHLRQHVVYLRRDERSMRAMKAVLRGHGCDDEVDFERLTAAGLVRGESRGAAEPACELYRRYFQQHLERRDRDQRHSLLRRRRHAAARDAELCGAPRRPGSLRGDPCRRVLLGPYDAADGQVEPDGSDCPPARSAWGSYRHGRPQRHRDEGRVPNRGPVVLHTGLQCTPPAGHLARP